jgi:hypothetical protein
MKLFRTIITAVFIAGACSAEYRFPVGERAVYKIKWGMVSCGTTSIHCDEVEVKDENLIRIRIRVKSNWMVSTVYPVDDTVDCFIDPETMESIRVEKDTSEGDLVCKDVLRLDRTNNIAHWQSHSANITTNYPITAGAHDPLSFLYAFRQHTFDANDERDFNVVVDTAVHGITITAKDTAKKANGNGEKVNCRKYLVTPKAEGLFVRKIPKEIWLTEDERKLMTRMTVKVPVGTARIVLDEYYPPES